MIIGIDVGYGNVKAVSEAGRRIIFPSVVTTASGGGELQKLLGGRQPKHRVTIAVDGEQGGEFLVGEAGLLVGASRSWNDLASERPNYRLLVLSALAVLGAEGSVEVGLGVPLGAYVDQNERKALRRLVKGTSATIAVHGGKPRHVKVEAVKIFPQGLGAYFHVVCSSLGERLAGQAVGIVDCGYRTSDVLLLLPGPDGVAVPIESRSGSVDVGIGRAVSSVRGYVGEQIGATFDAPEGLVESALAGPGTMTVRGRTLDLRPAYTRAVKGIADEIESHLRRVWAQDLDFLAGLVLAGGGGTVLEKHLTIPGVLVAPDPIYANSLGYAELMLQARFASSKPLV